MLSSISMLDWFSSIADLVKRDFNLSVRASFTWVEGVATAMMASRRNGRSSCNCCVVVFGGRQMKGKHGSMFVVKRSRYQDASSRFNSYRGGCGANGWLEPLQGDGVVVD